MNLGWRIAAAAGATALALQWPYRNYQFNQLSKGDGKFTLALVAFAPEAGSVRPSFAGRGRVRWTFVGPRMLVSGRVLCCFEFCSGQ